MALKEKYLRLCIAFFVLPFLFEVTSAYQRKNEETRIQTQQHKYEYTIVWYDSANARAFVVVNRKLMNTKQTVVAITRFIRDSLQYLIKVDSTPQRVKIDISFFDSEKYATYKDNIKPEEIMKWEESYLAEYIGEEEILQLYPLNPKKSKVMIVK